MLIKLTENQKPLALMYAPEAPKSPEAQKAPEAQTDSTDYSKIENRQKLYKKADDVIDALKKSGNQKLADRADILALSVKFARDEEEYAKKGDKIEEPEAIAKRLSTRLDALMKKAPGVLVLDEDKITANKPENKPEAPKVEGGKEAAAPQPPFKLIDVSLSDVPVALKTMAKNFAEYTMVAGQELNKYYTATINGVPTLYRAYMKKSSSQGNTPVAWKKVEIEKKDQA